MVESRLSRYLEKLEVAIVTVSLIGMLIAIFIQVVFRALSGLNLPGIQYFLTSTLMWTEEIARYLMVWSVFFGASMGAKRNVHIGIEAVVGLLPAAVGRYVYLLAGVVSSVFYLLVTWFGYQVMARIQSMGQTSPAMEMPMVIVYAAVPLGSALMAYRFMQAALHKFKTCQPEGKGA